MPVLADAPAEINYQGRLADASGNPITGNRVIKFRIMDAETVGAEVYSQTVSVAVSNGVFSVRIGSGSAIPSTVFQNSADRWLEVVVAGETLTPRQKLVGAPYALAIANDSAGTDQIRDMAVTLDKVDTVTVDGRYLTLGTNQTVTGTKTFDANISMVGGRTVDGVDISTHVLNSTNVHGIFGSVVGTTDSQTLLNKSISTGTLMWTTAVNSGGGLVFSGGSLVPNGIDFGSGSNDFLDATILSGLTSGGVTTLHSHAGALGESTIGTYHIINGTITIHDLAAASVGGDRIAASTVTSSHILDNTIASIDLGTDIIASTNIINGSVARVDLAVGSVGGDRIANSTVTTTHILDGTITSSDMAAESVGSTHIIDNSIVIADLAPGAVGGNRIAASTVTSSHILDGTIVNADISSSAEIDPGKVNGGSFQSEYYEFPGSSVTISGVYLKGGHIGIGTDPGSYALYMGDNRIKFTGIGSTPGIEWADGTISTSASSAGGGASIGPGTTDRIARFSGVSAISDSIIYQNAAGSGIGILTTPQAALDVAGNAQFGSSAKSTFTAAGVLQLASALTVPYGGTGATTLTSGGLLYGNGTGAVQALGVLTNGQLLIGDGSGAPTAATLLGSSTGVIVTNGAGSIILNTPQPINDSADVLFSTMALTNNLAVNTNVLVTRGGNVGVGTVSPNSYEKLTVNGNIRLIDPTHKIVFGDGSQLASANGLQTAVAVSSSTDVLITGDDDSTGGGNIHLRIGGTKRMTIFNNGTIGMGSDMSSAGAKLDVDGNAQFGNPGTKAVMSTTGGLTLVDDLVLTGDLNQSGGAVSVSSTTVNGSLSFSATGTMNLPTTAMTANGQLRYNSGTLAFRAGGAEVIVSTSTHTHNYIAVSGNVTDANMAALTGGGSTSLHSHPAAAPATHASTHYAGGSDSIAAGYVSTGTAQTISGVKTYTSSVTLSGVNLYVGGNETLAGDLTISGGNVNFGAATTIGDGGDALAIDSNGTLTVNDTLAVTTGINLSGGTAGAANTLDFGNGAADDLTATDVTDLTDGGATTLHTHAIAAHASSHAYGQSDSLASMYLTTHTTQDVSGAKTFMGGVIVQTTGMTVYSDLAASGNTVIGDGVGPDVLSFNGTGAYLSLPRAATAAEGQLRYNAGNRKLYFRNDSGELMLSDASHTHTGYLDTTGGTITGSLVIGDASGSDSLSFDATSGYLYLPTLSPLTGAGQIRYDSTSGIQYRNDGGTTVTLSTTNHTHNASAVYGGTFGTGAFVMQDDLTINGGNVNFGAATTIGDGGDALTINSNGTLTVDDALTVNTDLNVNGGNVNFGAATTIGDGGDALTLNSNGTLTVDDTLTVATGINLSGGTAGAANTMDFGNGANDDLTSTDVTDLTDGGSTSLHSHSTVATHASTHYSGGADTIESGYATTNTAQSIGGAKTFTSSVTLSGVGLYVGDNGTVAGDLTVSGGNVNFGAATTIGDAGDALRIDSNGTLTIADANILGTGALTLQSASGNALTLDTAGGTAAANLGTTNATGVTLGRSGYITTVGGLLGVTGTSTFTSSVTVSNDLYVGGGNLNFGAATTIGDGGDAITINSNGTLTVDDDLTVNTDLNVGGGNINFTAATTIGDGGDAITLDSNGTLTVNDILSLSGTNSLTVGGDATINGGNVNFGAATTIGDGGDALTIDSSGMLTVSDSLSVSGTGTFGSSVTVTGGNDLMVSGTMFFGTGGSYKVLNTGVATLGASFVGGLSNNSTSNWDFTAPQFSSSDPLDKFWWRVGASSTAVMSLGGTGILNVAGAVNGSSTPDLAEYIQASLDVEAADVVVVSHEGTKVAGPGGETVQVTKSRQAYDSKILGVISDGTSAFIINSHMRDIGKNHPGKPLVLAGRVPVKVCLENGPIQRGDYLTSSSKPGYAMKATEPGPTVGVALEDFTGANTGKILCFVDIGERNMSDEVKRLRQEVNSLRQQLAAQKKGGTVSPVGLEKDFNELKAQFIQMKMMLEKLERGNKNAPIFTNLESK